MAGQYGGIVVIKRNGKEGSVFPLQEEIIFGRYDSETHARLPVLFSSSSLLSFFLFFLLLSFLPPSLSWPSLPPWKINGLQHPDPVTASLKHALEN